MNTEFIKTLSQLIELNLEGCSKIERWKALLTCVEIDNSSGLIRRIYASLEYPIEIESKGLPNLKMKQECCTVERINPLKTPRQVREYLRKQAWYGSFKDLVIMEWNRPLWKRLRTLWGFDGALTIQEAFDFDKTVYGRKHWEKVNECFIAWYVGK